MAVASVVTGPANRRVGHSLYLFVMGSNASAFPTLDCYSARVPTLISRHTELFLTWVCCKTSVETELAPHFPKTQLIPKSLSSNLLLFAPSLGFLAKSKEEEKKNLSKVSLSEHCILFIWVFLPLPVLNPAFSKMITGVDLYHVLTAVVPLYVAMILAYGSVKWWKIFTPDQCSGINRFVALFAVPLLSFHFISTNNPYAMNFHFIAADTLQKIMVLVVLAIWTKTSSRGCLEWTITLFSLSTLPNTLVMGIPLLKGMYGAASGTLMVQIVVLQCIIWYTLMLFLFEYRGARLLITEQFPDTAGSIISFRVDSDIISLDGKEPLQTEAEVGEDGKLHVTVRKSTSSRSDIFSRRSHGLNSGLSLTPRPSNLTNAEIYSLQSSRNPTPRGSSFNHTDFYSMVNGRNASPRQSNFGAAGLGYDEECGRGGAANGVYQGGNVGGYPAPPSTGMFSPVGAGAAKKAANGTEGGGGGGKDLHMFVWSSSASPVSEGGIHVFRAGGEFGNDHRHPPPQLAGGVPHSTDHQRPKERLTSPEDPDFAICLYEQWTLIADAHHDPYDEYGRDDFSFGNRTVGRGGEALHKDHDGPTLSKLGSSSTAELRPKSAGHGETKPTSMPPASVMTRLILIMVWRKLIRNPNTYSSLIGLTWSLVSFKYDILSMKAASRLWELEMPAIIAKSIAILSDAGLGMAMFSLGLFMALQPKIIACGNSVAAFAMAIRFLTGPAVMAAASIAVGLRGTLLRIAIVQAALPQGIVPFVFAKEYNVHPDILSTGFESSSSVLIDSELYYNRGKKNKPTERQKQKRKKADL
ncbi:hypothetical protein ACLOJK_024818 [Asimina triloba]